MKKGKWIYIVLILFCAAVFLGYRALDVMRQDTKPPEIMMDGQLSISVLDSQDALLQGVSAKDDRDGNVTDSLVVESIIMTGQENTAKVVYAAFDSAGHVTKAERTVVFTDYRKPRFSLSAPLIYPSSASFDVLDRIRAEDDLDGDISKRIRATSLTEESIGVQGSHDVKFRVTNSLGDSSELVLPVEVYPADAYKASLSLTDYLIYLAPGTAFNPKDYLYEYTRFDETIYLRGAFPEELSLKINGKVDTTVPGVYAVSYTVTGTLRETDYAAYSKLIVVVEG